jgi:hypothetical protein
MLAEVWRAHARLLLLIHFSNSEDKHPQSRGAMRPG